MSTPLQIFNAEIMEKQPLELVDQSIGKRVTILTNSMCLEFRGILKGVDNYSNCILEDCDEYSPINPNYKAVHHKQVLVNGAGIQVIVPDQPPVE